MAVGAVFVVAGAVVLAEAAGGTSTVLAHHPIVQRTCSSANASVPVGSPLPAYWRTSKRTITAGGIAWFGLGDASYPPGTLTPHNGLAPAVKSMAVVEDRTQVRVVIPAAERQRLSLDYSNVLPRDPQQSLFRVSDGAYQVTFDGCSKFLAGGANTLFAGGFIVAGPQCATIDVYTSPDGTRVVQRIPFGVSTRTCAPALI